MLFVGTSIIHPSTEGVFLLCNILDLLIYSSDLLQDKEVRKILENPEDYIDSTEFFSWEQYFTKLLIQKTEGTYLQYKKAKLNPSYLQDKNKNKILESIQGIQWKIKSLK